MIAANGGNRNRTAQQVWLTEQKCPQRAIGLLAQMTQFAGQARQWQEAARKYPGLAVAFKNHFADQRQGRWAHPQHLAFIQCGATYLLSQYLYLKPAFTFGD